MSALEKHVESARQHEALYLQSLQAYERTGKVSFLIDATMMAQGAATHWRCAGNDILHERALVWRNSCRLNLLTSCGA